MKLLFVLPLVIMCFLIIIQLFKLMENSKIDLETIIERLLNSNN